MEIYFYWNGTLGNFTPNCRSTLVNKDGVSPLACILTDSGGQPYQDTLPWLEEGLNRINSIKNHTVDFIDWSRDAWGAELTCDQVKIYSLYDDNYFESIKINDFEKALLAWKDFIRLGPGTEQKIEI